MATTTLQSESARATAPSADEMPDLYASTVTGDCLAPRFPDGTALLFSKLEKPEEGDFVGLWIDEGDSVGRYVKRLRSCPVDSADLPYKMHPQSECEYLLLFETLNPPRVLSARASRVLAMHKVVGTADLNGDGTASPRPFNTVPPGSDR